MTVKVRIENAYSNGHESTKVVELPVPSGDVDAWFDEVVHDHTGDGTGIDSSLGFCYTATIVEAPDPALVGRSFEWAGI